MATSAPAAIITGTNEVESSVVMPPVEFGTNDMTTVELGTDDMGSSVVMFSVTQLPEGLRLPSDITITSLHSPLLYAVSALI